MAEPGGAGSPVGSEQRAFRHARAAPKSITTTPTLAPPDNIHASPAGSSEAQHSTPGTTTPGPVPGSHWLAMFAPEPLVVKMLDDWFSMIHSLAPTLVRRRFMRRLRGGVADVDAVFCGLVVSICAATKATLPRRDYGLVTVDYCAEFLDTHDLLRCRFGQGSFTLDWCIAMYNMGTAMGATTATGLSNMRAYHALSEAAAGARYLAYYRAHDHDEIGQQILRRLIWLLFAAARYVPRDSAVSMLWLIKVATCRSADMFGRLSTTLLDQDRIESFPRPLPLSDNQLAPPAVDDSGEPWHGDDTTYIPGLNSLSDLFLIWQQAQHTPRDSDAQTNITNYLAKIQSVLDSLPPELRWRGGLSRPSHVTQGHDVQIANLFVTSLAVRSNILQKFGPTDTTCQEHQKIIDDLLEILYHLPRAVFDANGSSLVPKIRDVGAAYLEQSQLGNGVSAEIVGDARDKLERLLRKLDDLDCWQGLGILDSPPLRVEAR
ncbi:hypothetical protein F66182_4664 [Fusarium sp. NRRL 66182]|nr:hypothetical protein F66182_4664 [Fusarium sp. NRRL 66182]